MKSQLWTESSQERCSFIRGSNASVTKGDDEWALQRLWREKRGEVEPEHLSGKPRPTQPYGFAPPRPHASPVSVAHAEFIGALAGHPPRPIPVDADAIDLEDRADHVSGVFRALSAYLAVILDDTAQNVPGGLDLRDVEGLLADLASDLSGTIQHAAEGMAGRVA
jgi:hypothetical protein